MASFDSQSLQIFWIFKQKTFP